MQLSMSTSSSSSCSFCSSSCSYSSLCCLSRWCAGSAVSLTLLLAVLALVLAQAAFDFKNNSVSLQHFSPSANSALLHFSFSTPPCVFWCLDSFFVSLSSVNFQSPTSNKHADAVYSIQSSNSQKALLHFNCCKQIIKFKNAGRFVLFLTMHVFEHLNKTFSYKTMQTDLKKCEGRL